MNDQGKLKDGFTTLERGMNAGRAPSLLGPDQYALGVNTTMRGGYITHRPGFKKVTLDFNGDATVQARFEDGRFQRACYYESIKETVDDALVASIGGRLVVIKVAREGRSTNYVSEISITGDLNNDAYEQVWLAQAEEFMVLQDNQKRALIYDGVTVRRSDAGRKEVPIGTVMAYGFGRLWVAQGRNFVGSDIVGGPTGSATYEQRDAVLRFTENDYLNEGGAFGVPLQSGEITALKFGITLDTALGQGELMVFTTGSVFAVNVPANRDEWKNLEIPLQRFAGIGFGSESQTIPEVNSDLWFRSKDGIRSLVMAVRNFGQWGNTPQSREVQSILQQDDARLLKHASAVCFDNRLLMTCSPRRDHAHGIYHKGMVALNFDSVSGLNEAMPPGYDGIWTGLNTLQIVRGEFHGKERCFIFALNTANKIELWELTKDEWTDRTGGNTRAAIQWQVDPRSLSFQTPDVVKELESGRIWFDQIRGAVTFTVQYRPDQYPFWNAWEVWTACALVTKCTPDCPPDPFGSPQYRTRRRLPAPAFAEETSDNKPMIHGFEFQPRIKVTGSARLKRVELIAKPMTDYPNGEDRNNDDCSEIAECGDNIFSYLIN